MINYVKSNFKEFYVQPPNEIDYLILSWLSYLTLDMYGSELLLKDIYHAENFTDMLMTTKDRDNSLELLAAAAASPRFRDIRIKNYESILNDTVQFAAVTYMLQDGTNVIAFRGTDNSFSGWKEDLDLSLSDAIPSQKLAADYLKQITDSIEGDIVVCGHSKGGNLSVYAAAKMEAYMPGRIKHIYSFDGPGFLSSDFDEGFLKIRDRITKIIPQSSLVGMFFDSECELKIVKSSSVSIAQHNPFYWKIDDGEFVLRKELTADAKIANRAFNKWVYSLSFDERSRFIRNIFDALEESGAEDFEDLVENIRKYLPIVTRKYINMDKEDRKFMRNCLARLGESGLSSIPELLIGEFKHQEE